MRYFEKSPGGDINIIIITLDVTINYIQGARNFDTCLRLSWLDLVWKPQFGIIPKKNRFSSRQ